MLSAVTKHGLVMKYLETYQPSLGSKGEEKIVDKLWFLKGQQGFNPQVYCIPCQRQPLYSWGLQGNLDTCDM